MAEAIEKELKAQLRKAERELREAERLADEIDRPGDDEDIPTCSTNCAGCACSGKSAIARVGLDRGRLSYGSRHGYKAGEAPPTS